MTSVYNAWSIMYKQEIYYVYNLKYTVIRYSICRIISPNIKLTILNSMNSVARKLSNLARIPFSSNVMKPKAILSLSDDWRVLNVYVSIPVCPFFMKYMPHGSVKHNHVIICFTKSILDDILA